jgi:putative intracellular protease/amidase
MALQTSGAISLNDIHVEAGGTTGTVVSINDSDIRNLIGKTAGASMAFNEWYGASASTVVTVTQGILSLPQATHYGYEDGTPTGSVSPTTVDGSTITGMTIKIVYRTTASAGTFFTIDVSSGVSNAIDADEFTSFSFIANGTLTTLLTSEASTTTIAGGFVRRWTWSSSYGLDSTEIANINAEWDGSGDVEVTFRP